MCENTIEISCIYNGKNYSGFIVVNYIDKKINIEKKFFINNKEVNIERIQSWKIQNIGKSL